MDNVENVENTEQDNPNYIQELIKASLDQDYNHANKIFGEVMTIKMSDLLDQEKVKMADQVYNGVPEEEEPIPDDEELAAEAEGEDEDEEEDADSEEPSDEEEEEEEEIEGAAV
tara:strand:- start:343 stop:684 length:342 start_codon:yes stop_codon:yes gene_type:complete